MTMPARRIGTIRRFVTPSLSDVLFATIIAWSFLTSPVGWLALLMDGDTGFHIRVGDWILAHHQFPTTHPFTFSVTGKEFFAFEWLSQVLMSLLHTAWGLKGITLAAGLLIAVIFTLLYRYILWRGANPVLGVVAIMVAINACRIHFLARPHLFTWLFLVIAIWLLEHDSRRRSSAVWWLAPITVFWANLHGGFMILFAVLALWSMSAGSWMAVRRYALVGSACLAGSFLNPYSYHLHLHIVKVVTAQWIMNVVEEFKSPSFRTEPMLAFMVLLFFALALTWPLLQRRKYGEVALIWFLAYSSLISVRHVPVFAVVVAPILALELTEFWEKMNAPGKEFATGAARTSLWPAVLVLLLALLPGLAWPEDFPSDLFPTEIVGRHREMLASAHVFTTDQWADYLIYRNYPKQRDYFDGQHQYYGETHANAYLATLGGKATWRDTLEKFPFEYALCPKKQPIAALMRTDPKWKLIDDAGLGLLFARTGL